MKVRRDTSVNGEEERGLHSVAVNEGGTAEFFGPFMGAEISAVFMPACKSYGL